MSPQVPEHAHLSNVARAILAGKVVPFLGAGANLCGRPEGQSWSQDEYLPSGAELAQELIRVTEYPDPDDRDLMRITQYIYATLGDEPLYGFIRRPLFGDYPPTALHHLLAGVARMLAKAGKPRQVILTTNYDDLLERAFIQANQPFDLLWYEAKPTAANCGSFIHQKGAIGPIPPPVTIDRPNEYVDLDLEQCTVIVKLHGAMVPGEKGEERDSYVITEDDYIRYLTGADIASQLPAVVRTPITESHLLFLGYGMRDWNLRVVLERLGGAAALSSKDWSVQRKPSSEASELIEASLWAKRDVDLRFMLLDEYVQKLTPMIRRVRIEEEERARVEAARRLARAQAPHPVSVAPDL